MIYSKFINNKAWLTLCLIFVSVLASGQADSLYQALQQSKRDSNEVILRQKIFAEIRYTDPDHGKAHLDTALELARALDYTLGEASVLRLMASYYNAKDYYEKSFELAEQSLKLFEQIDHVSGQIRALNSLGVSKWKQGKLAEAQEFYLKTLAITKENNDDRGIAIAYHNLAAIHITLKNFEKAEKYLNLMVVHSKKANYTRGLLFGLNGLASLKAEKTLFDAAIQHSQEALTIAESINDMTEYARVQMNIGTYYKGKHEIDSALYYWNKSLIHFKKLNIPSTTALIQINMAETYSDLGQYNLARQYADSALQTSRAHGMLDNIKKAYHALVSIEKSSKNYKQALAYHEQYMVYRDSLSGVEVHNKINELETKYETEKKEQQNALLQERMKVKELELEQEQENNDLKDLKLKQQNYLIAGLVGGLLLLGGTGLLYVRQRRAREKQKAAELEQKALRAQMNPHFIFNSLNSIQSLYIEDKEEDANQYMSNFSSLLRIILDQSGEKLITLQKEIETLKLFLELEQMRNEEQVTYNIQVDPNLDVHHLYVPPLILQPFAENAIWHGILPSKEKGHIQVTLQDHPQYIYCTVEDDGVGIDQAKPQHITHTSKGMTITEQRLGKGSVAAEPRTGGGTIVHIKISKNL